MILAFHPGQAEIPGANIPVPNLWVPLPWANLFCRASSFGSILIQEYITDSFSIFSWRLDIHKSIRLYPSSSEPTLALQFTLEGNIPFELEGYGEQILKKGSCAIFYVPQGTHAANFGPGQYESLHIELRMHWLEKLATVHPGISQLIIRLRNASPYGLPVRVVEISYMMQIILNNLKACKLEGAPLRFEFHKYIFELLSEYLGELVADGRFNSKLNLIESIKDYILASPHIGRHSVKQISFRFQIKESRLKREFKEAMGVPVSHFVREKALELAHHLLRTTDREIEDIAEGIGYSSQQAFHKTFKSRYGIPPSLLRKKAKKISDL